MGARGGISFQNLIWLRCHLLVIRCSCLFCSIFLESHAEAARGFSHSQYLLEPQFPSLCFPCPLVLELEAAGSESCATSQQHTLGEGGSERAVVITSPWAIPWTQASSLCPLHSLHPHGHSMVNDASETLPAVSMGLLSNPPISSVSSAKLSPTHGCSQACLNPWYSLPCSRSLSLGRPLHLPSLLVFSFPSALS